jgi:hypothetical protein
MFSDNQDSEKKVYRKEAYVKTNLMQAVESKLLDGFNDKVEKTNKIIDE